MERTKKCPVKIKVIIEHMDRLFALGEDNRIYWTREDDYGNWYNEPENLQDVTEQDAGFWEIQENEEPVKHVETIKSTPDGLKIYTDKWIYLLTGYNNETFCLQKHQKVDLNDMETKASLVEDLKEHMLLYAVNVFRSPNIYDLQAIEQAMKIAEKFGI